MPGKREDVISWDEFFMRAAVAASLRSKDPNTQVGACIADTNNRILSVGYNGTPSALNDDDFPWGTADDPLHDKHNYVIHAEANAILNYRGSLKDMAGATVYVTCTWTTSTAAPRITLSPGTSSIAAASRIARSSSGINVSIGDRHELIRRQTARVKGDGCKLHIVRFAPAPFTHWGHLVPDGAPWVCRVFIGI